MAKQDDYARYTIRIPKDVYARLEKSAHEANRSLNSEIIARLDASLNSVTFNGETSLDNVISYYLRRFQSGPYVEGQDAEVANLIKNSKEMEIKAINTMVDGALEIINKSKYPADL